MQHISFVKRAFLCFLLVSVMSFAAQKTAGGYYRDAAFQYIENRLPTAEITCKEGLSYYPNDMKLQMLLDRIQEAKEEQKNKNKEQNKDQQDQNQDQEQNKDQQDQNQDQGQNDEQNQDEGKDPNAPQEVPVGQMSPEEASQLLKDFNEQNGEQKPWKPVRGQARPLKDW